jgi:predicted RNase H-like HicB family nuclease
MARAKVKGHRFTVVLEKDEVDGGYSVQCIELPGAISQGQTKEEALKNIREALELYLESWPDALEELEQKKKVVSITV